MKKLFIAIALILVIAMAFCSCRENKDEQLNDITTNETDESVLQTEDTTVEESESESQAETEEVTTKEKETKPSIPPVIFDFGNIEESVIKSHFSEANQTELNIESDEDGEAYIKLTTSGDDVSDPNITLNIQGLSKKAGVSQPNAKVYKYVVMKVKTVGMTNGSFGLYYTTSSNTWISNDKLVSAGYDVDNTEWQYILFDFENQSLWTDRIIKLRLDYTHEAQAAGESLCIAEIKFIADDAEYYESIGSDFDDIGFEISKENADKAQELLSSVTGHTTAFDSYKGESAEFEDASLDIWFDHMYDRTAINNNVSTGKISYQMMLAKNEKEACQLILSSDNDVEGLKIYISDFKNASGHTLQTSLFWGYYFNIDGEMVVEPIVPVNYTQSEFMKDWMSGNNSGNMTFNDHQKYNGFDIKGGQNQTFIIKVTTEADTPAGEYSATVRILDKDGREVKKVTVFTYVWDFTLSDSSAGKTLMDLDSFSLYYSYGDFAGILCDDTGRSLYEIYYEFLLENRVCAYSIPGVKDLGGSGIYSDIVKKYINDPRVVAFVTLGFKQDLTPYGLQNAYAYLSQNPNLLDKAYFYPIDEPLTIGDLDRVNYFGAMLKENFPGYKLIVPMHVNYPVAGGDYFSYVDDYVTTWCPYTFFYTTFAEWYQNKELIYGNCPAVDAKLGAFRDRIKAEQAGGDEAWWYVTDGPKNPEITVMIDMEAVNYRTLFWQQKLYDIDGFLYYTVNDWGNNTIYWKPSTDTDFMYGLDAKHEIKDSDGVDSDVYGNGVLIYSGVYFGQLEPVGGIRLECIRDGIEDFEYLTMLEEIYGYDVVQAIVHTWTQSLSEYNTDKEAFAALREQVAMLLEGANE